MHQVWLGTVPNLAKLFFAFWLVVLLYLVSNYELSPLYLEIPTFTLRLIKSTLPKYEALGVPDIVRRMTYQPQGLILP